MQLIPFARWRRPLLWLGLAIAVALYVYEVPANPPGFFVDESSIAYNACTISEHGADEHGESWPLYFRAFGEYKNPPFIYLLAGCYAIFGPSEFAARLLSALLVLSAALLIGALAGKIARSLLVAVIIGGSACLTPWLFEPSRLAFEIACLPLAIGLFLWVLHTALSRAKRPWLDPIILAFALGLMTYSSGAGRVLAPLFCIGMVFCRGKNGWLLPGRTWLLYAVSLVPLLLFLRNHPGALGTRFGYVTYLTAEAGTTDALLSFLRHYVAAFNPWSWLIEGDPEPRHHLAGMGSLLIATAVLACTGIVLFFGQRLWRDRWWRYAGFGLLVAPIPAALTIDRFHSLRLIALPIFLLLFASLALAWLLEGSRLRRGILIALVFATVAQGAAFQWQFHHASGRRWHSFDTFYPEVFRAAIARPERPIYLMDAHGAPGYIHAYWYGLFEGLKKSDFVRLEKDQAPPGGALVISCEMPCRDCTMIIERASFRAYLAR